VTDRLNLVPGLLATGLVLQLAPVVLLGRTPDFEVLQARRRPRRQPSLARCWLP